MRKLVLGTVVALAVAGGFAAISLGGSTDRPSGLDRDFERIRAHRTHTPSASASATGTASAKGKPKVKYFETAAIPVPVPGNLVSTSCPNKYKALSGYFLSDGGIVLDTSAISEESTRTWVFGLLNASGSAGQAIVGVVCGKKL